MMSILAASSTLVTDVVPCSVDWAIPIGLTILVVIRLMHLFAVVPKLRLGRLPVMVPIMMQFRRLVPLVTYWSGLITE